MCDYSFQVSMAGFDTFAVRKLFTTNMKVESTQPVGYWNDTMKKTVRLGIKSYSTERYKLLIIHPFNCSGSFFIQCASRSEARGAEVLAGRRA
jgi:hypothetical protein